MTPSSLCPWWAHEGTSGSEADIQVVVPAPGLALVGPMPGCPYMPCCPMPCCPMPCCPYLGPDARLPIHALLPNAPLPIALWPIPVAPCQAAHTCPVAPCPAGPYPAGHTFPAACSADMHTSVEQSQFSWAASSHPGRAVRPCCLQRGQDTDHCNTASELCCTVPHKLPGLQRA